MQLTPAGHVTVAFEGPGAGSGPLSWGQIESWNAVRTLGHWMPIGGALPLKPGTTVSDVAEELRHHVSRHPTLRTRLVVPPGDGTPTQIVLPSGSTTLEVYDSSDADPAGYADTVAEQYRRRELDFASELPVRMAVVLHRGAPSHLVALVSHFAADAAGAMIMLRDVQERPVTPVDGRQPLDQAAWQASAAGRRQHDAAMRHCEAILRTMEPERFRTPSAVSAPRFWRAAFDSAALPLALRAIAARTGADASALLLAVYAAALYDTFGRDPVVIRPLVSNRFRPGLADVVCTAVQAGLCSIPAGGASFDEVVAHARRVTPTAYKLAYFDQRELFALRDRIGAERGVALSIGCFLNDRRDPSAGAGGPTPTAGEVTSALPRSRFEWITKQEHPKLEPLILDVEDTPEGLRATAHTDTACVSPADTEAVLRAMERIAVEASTR